MGRNSGRTAGHPVAGGALHSVTRSAVVVAGGQPIPDPTAHAFAVRADH